MSLSPDLRALDSQLRRDNTARRDRLHDRREEDAAKPWRVTYRYACDRPGAINVHYAETPRDLVRFLRDGYPATMDLIVVRVWEAEG